VNGPVVYCLGLLNDVNVCALGFVFNQAYFILKFDSSPRSAKIMLRLSNFSLTLLNISLYLFVIIFSSMFPFAAPSYSEYFREIEATFTITL
jgi:hypothetical protein